VEATPDTYWDLFFGYGAIWLCVAVFVIKLRMEQRKLIARLDELERAQSLKKAA
jgi:CcmD family protein